MFPSLPRRHEIWLTAVTKNDIRSGKSGSFDGTDEEWQQILLDALFGTGKPDIHLSAQIAKNQEKLTVFQLHHGVDRRSSFSGKKMIKRKKNYLLASCLVGWS